MHQSRYAVMPTSCCCCCYHTLYDCKMLDLGLLHNITEQMVSSIIHDSTDYQTSNSCLSWSQVGSSRQVKLSSSWAESLYAVTSLTWQYIDFMCKSNVQKDTSIMPVTFVFYVHFLSLWGLSIIYTNNVQNWIKIRKGGNCDALQIEGRPTSRQSFFALITRLTEHQPANSTFTTSTEL